MASKTQGSWHTRLLRAAKSDPKKAGVLSVLVIVMAVMWAKLMFNGAPGPAAAVAAFSAEASDNSALDRAAAKADKAGAALQEWISARKAPLQRNLFAVKLDYFRQDANSINNTLLQPTGTGFWDQVAKSMTVQADQKKERQILIENLQLQAAQLRLQTTMMGPQPKALINGDLVGEGDVVATFRVSKIEARRIIVEREGIKLEILMK